MTAFAGWENFYVIVGSAAGHPLANKRRIAPEHLRDASWVAFPPRRGSATDPFGQVTARSLAAAGLHDAEMIVIDSLTAQKRLVEAGFGLALVPESSAREELALNTLRKLDVPALRAAIEVVLIHRQGAFLSPATRQLLDVLSKPPEERSARRPTTGRR